MKVAISIPDDVFAEADQMAAILKTTRSALYGRALKAYLQNLSTDQTCEALNRVVDAIGFQDRSFTQAAGRRMLFDAEW